MARRSTTKDIASQIEESTERKPNSNLESVRLIGSSSTLLNVACSERRRGAFSAGGMINIIGDSHTGKTALALSILADAAYNPEFDEYDLIFDDAENANLFDIKYMFGRKTAKRIKAPHYDEEGLPEHSRWIEDFHCNIADALDSVKPFIYVLDSFDAIDSEQDAKKVEEMREARRKKQKTSGSYGMAKPKKASELLRNICGDLKNTQSLLIIISQTRDNIDIMSFQKKTRSGGRALKFYALHEIWLANGGTIKSKKRNIGSKVKAKISKNKLTGKVREVELRIYDDYGVDDISVNVEFLVEEGFWSKTKNTINAEDFGIKGSLQTIVKHVEDNNLEEDLAKLVEEGWLEIEEELKLNRKPKYE